MKKKVQQFSWFVKNFDVNRQVIENYDVLKYREDDIKKLKKKCETKEEFDRKLSVEMMYHFWSRAEYELIVRLLEDGRVMLRPWCGCRNEDEAEIDVTNTEDFDWVGFAKYHIGKQIYRNEAKIDIYDQLYWQWNEFVDYIWNYHHKWQRRKVND